MTTDDLHQVDVATDPLTREDLVELASATGPHASLLMPTSRMGPSTRMTGRQFSRLCEELRRVASDRGVDDDLVDRVEEQAHGDEFWQHQAEGLAVVAGPDTTMVRRLGAPLAPEVAVGRPRIRPLLPHVTDGTRFHLLALSTGRVRLFEGSEHTMRELPLGPVPSSYDELALDRDPQQSLQWAPVGGGAVNYHAHGGDASAERTHTVKFLRIVSQELRRRFPAGAPGGAGEEVPLLLACVPENLALFRSAGGHPRLVDDVVVAGNADRTTPAELHEQAWEVVAPRLRGSEEAALAQVLELRGTGRVIEDLDQVLVAAWEGRVERLFVGASSQETAGEPTTVIDDPVDLVVARVLAAGGHCAVQPEALDRTTDSELVALLRW
jgi:hypothetical protein